MCGSMADIQSAAAEIRRGKKIDRKIEEETTGKKFNGLPYYIYRAAIITRNLLSRSNNNQIYSP